MSGNETIMRVPCPGALSGVMVPPYASIKRLGNCQPQAVAAGIACARAVAAMEALEDVSQLLLRNPGPVVCDLDYAAACRWRAGEIARVPPAG